MCCLQDLTELQKERQCLERQHQQEVNKLNQELQQARTLHNALQAQADKVNTLIRRQGHKIIHVNKANKFCNMHVHTYTFAMIKPASTLETEDQNDILYILFVFWLKCLLCFFSYFLFFFPATLSLSILPSPPLFFLGLYLYQKVNKLISLLLPCLLFALVFSRIRFHCLALCVLCFPFPSPPALLSACPPLLSVSPQWKG